MEKLKIKQIRTEKGISIAELARISGISRMTITTLESDDSRGTTTLSTLRAIANALEVSVPDLFCFE